MDYGHVLHQTFVGILDTVFTGHISRVPGLRQLDRSIESFLMLSIIGQH